MIRIEASDKDLLEAIEKKKPGWIEDARERTKKAVQAGKVGEGEGTWSQIKEVFVLLQEFKCAYCEFPLPQVETNSADKMAVDCDIEHYRPKNRVTAWPTPDILQKRPAIHSYMAGLSAGASAGYVRLAFDPLNYVISCKVCNKHLVQRGPLPGRWFTRRSLRGQSHSRSERKAVAPLSFW